MSNSTQRLAIDQLESGVSSTGRGLLRLAWPIAISMMSFSMMTLVSTAFVARLGADQLAGVGLACSVGFVVVCFGIGVLRACKTLVSQAVGAGRHDRIPELSGAAIVVALALGVAALVVGRLIAPALGGLPASPHVGLFAGQYLAIRSLGAPVVLLYAALRETRHGQGDSRAPMRASLAGNAVNLALDALLIVGLGWGVRGAAVATIGGSTTELAVLAWTMRGTLRGLRWRRSSLRAVWSQGVPSGLQFVMETGSFLILTVMLARMSAIDSAAHQVVLRLVNVSFLPAQALGEAVAVQVGQAIGANRDALVARVARRALAIGAGYAAVCALAYSTFGGLLAHAMAAGNAALAARVTTLMHISVAFLAADASSVIARGILRGASDVRYAAGVGIATSWLITPPLTWLFGYALGLGAVGGWLGLATQITVGASLFWWRIARGGWRTAAVAARRAMAGVGPGGCR